MPKYKFSTIGANENGSKIFCKLALDKHNLLRGYYDFDKEKFIVIKYLYHNFPQGVTKNEIKKALKKMLLLNYDWEL